jgi:hypothetical protein
MLIFPKDKTKKEKKNLKRAIAENVAVMSVSQVNYWLKYSNWIEDWQFELTWADQKKKLIDLEGYKFDSNCFRTNWTHGISGALYYNFARTNNLNVFESSLFATVTSFYWEMVVEWREVVSINDSIFTSFGGIGIGESFFQLGSYFAGRNGIVNKFAEIITNPVLALNRWLDRNKNYTYYKPQKREMMFYAGNYFSMSDTGKPYKNAHQFFGFSSSLTYLPKIEKKGHIEKIIKGTILSDMGFRFEMKDGAVDDITAYTRNVYFGKYQHKITEYQKNSIKGAGSLYGLMSGFDFYKKRAIADNDDCQQYKYIDESMYVKTPTEFTDKLAVLNLIGGYTELFYYFNHGKIIYTGMFSVDFGLINTFALNEYSKTEPIAYTKATLYNYGYYYGIGFTLRSGVNISYRRVTVNLEYKYQKYNSIDGADRFQDKILHDFNIKDSKSILRFNIGYKLGQVPLGLKLMIESKYRKGIIENISNKEKETKVYVRLEVFL